MKESKVHLREKKRANNMIGYYLDYSIDGKRKLQTIKDLKSGKGYLVKMTSDQTLNYLSNA